MSNKAQEKLEESFATPSKKTTHKANQSGEYRYIGPAETVFFGGLEFKRDEPRSVSDLTADQTLQLASNPYFAKSDDKRTSADLRHLVTEQKQQRHQGNATQAEKLADTMNKA